MSTSIHVRVQCKLTPDILSSVRLYNDLVQAGYTPPKRMTEDLRLLLGNDDCEEWGYSPLVVSGQAGELVESSMKHEGDVMYGDGMTILVTDLPTNAVALRVYAVS